MDLLIRKVGCLCKQEEIVNKNKLEKKKRAEMTSRIGQLLFFYKFGIMALIEVYCILYLGL